MANQLFDVQISIPSAAKNPFVAGNKRLSNLNLAQLIRALAVGSVPGLSGSGAYLQYQSSVVAASGTVTAAAVQSGDTVSIAGQAITAAQKRATGTVTAASVQAGDTVSINGQAFTAVSGAVTPGEATFDCSGTDSQCAASIAAQVLAYGGSKVAGIVGARSAAAVCTFYAINEGTSGNAISLASSNGGRLAVSGAALANGAAPSNNTFDFAGTNATTAASIASAINASTTAAVKQVTASASNAVCTVTAKVGGTAGNALAWVSSNGSRLAVSGSGTLTNGSASAVTRFNF